MKKKPKAGVPLKEAMERGFNQVIGLPGVSYAKGGKFFNAVLIEVDEHGERVPEKEPARDVDDGGFAADAIGESVGNDSVAGGDEPVGAADGSVPSETVQGESGADAVAVDNPLQARHDEAKAELDAWTAANDASTEEGKREYNRLYARVRSAKKALEKAGA